MSSNMLDAMRQRMKDRQPQRGGGDNSIFLFWKLQFGKSSTLRLLPFNDEFTGGFWTERITLPMTFVDPEDESKFVYFNAPCLEMYGRNTGKCPALEPVRDLYAQEKELRNSGQTKDADQLKRVAGAHWKKPLYYYQGFVVNPGFTEEEVPENPIRVFPFNKKLHSLIYDSLLNEEDPFDFLPVGEFTIDDIKTLFDGGEVDPDKFMGYNFICKKMEQGGYADWTTGSTWSKKAEVLTDEQLEALNTYGLHDLSKRLPDRPSDEQYGVLKEMMQISIDRVLTGENGVWRKEWEEDCGFKPYRKRGDGGGDAAASGDGESKPKAASTRKSAGTKDALDRLRSQRGKGDADEGTETASAAEAVEAAEDNAPVEEPSEAPSTSGSLADRIRNRVKQSA